MKKIVITSFLIITFLFCSSSFVYSQKLHFGIISAIKNKVKQLKEKKEKELTQTTSVGTLKLLQEATQNQDLNAMEPLFTEEEWNRSKSYFEENIADLPKLAKVFDTQTLIKEEDDVAIYTVTAVLNGEQVNFYIILIRDSGKWKISGL